MLDIKDIIRTALQEHDGETGLELEDFIGSISARLDDVASIPAYDHTSKPLSLVSFRCMLQDTGYPMEVYLPGEQPQEGQEVDWSKLRERWVGWGVEIPGENDWVKNPSSDSLSNGLASLHMNGSTASHPPALQSKFHLSSQSANYLGALVKVYDDVSFRPASTHTFVGLLSTAALPSPISASGNEADEAVIVPTIHVLRGPLPPPVEESIRDVEATRSALLQYLASELPVDALSAEYILLALLASPSVRPPALQPLGTLSLNLIGAIPSLSATLRRLVPATVDLPLTLQTLHSTSFTPSSTTSSASDSSSLSSGLLQLAEGTVLVIDETAMGDGGKLLEKAVRNLQALTETMAEQKVRYEYPYMDGLKMDAWIRPIVLSDGKSLVPVDIHLPLLPSTSTPSPSSSTTPDLPAFRSYLRKYGSLAHARKLVIPESTAAKIQDDFVTYRRAQGVGGDAEEVLKRRMKIARLVAVSYEDAVLSEERWARVIEMDEEAEKRMKDRKKCGAGK